jgi:hypothetical protein
MDIIFTFDTTGSMSSVIAEVRYKLRQAVTDLFDKIPGLRIGIVSHGDYCDYRKVIDIVNLTDDVEKLLHFISNTPNTGGGDAAECYEYVMHRVNNMIEHRNDTTVVMVGDAYPHDQRESRAQIHRYLRDLPGFPYTTSLREGLDWRKEADRLGTQIYTIQCLSRSNQSVTFWTELAARTGGYHLRLTQFSDIVETMSAIAFHQVSDEQLNQYAQTLSESGTLTRGLATIIDTLLDEPTTFDPKTYSYEPRRIAVVGRWTRGLKPIPDGLVTVDPDRFMIGNVGHEDVPVKELLKRYDLVFKLGKVFYELRKSVTVQERKEVVVMDRETGDLFSGKDARKIIGSEYGTRGTVHPRDVEGNWTVFIQSTSANRKMLKHTKFLYDME